MKSLLCRALVAACVIAVMAPEVAASTVTTVDIGDSQIDSTIDGLLSFDSGLLYDSSSFDVSPPLVPTFGGSSEDGAKSDNSISQDGLMMIPEPGSVELLLGGVAGLIIASLLRCRAQRRMQTATLRVVRAGYTSFEPSR